MQHRKVDDKKSHHMAYHSIKIDCLGRFVPEMTYYVSSGTLNRKVLK